MVEEFGLFIGVVEWVVYRIRFCVCDGMGDRLDFDDMGRFFRASVWIELLYLLRGFLGQNLLKLGLYKVVTF